METVAPIAPASRTITVLTRLLPEGTPLSGVSVAALSEQGGEQLAAAITNGEGAAVFLLENIPTSGRNIMFRAARAGRQEIARALICNDTTIVFLFSAQPPASANCASLSGVDSLRFRSDALPPSDSLIQNEPRGIAEYTRCWSFVNSGNDTISFVLTDRIRSASPFRLTAVTVNGRALALSSNAAQAPPGGNVSLCFSVSTANAGDFNEELPLEMLCRSGERGVFRLRLRALVVARTCECQSSSSSEISVTTSERVAVGAAQEIANTVLYVNRLSCPVSVNLIGIRPQQGAREPEWSLLEPASRSFPLQLAEGESLIARLRFSPRVLVSGGDILLLEIRPVSTQQVCTVAVRLNGLACRNDCPTLQTLNQSYPFTALPAAPTAVNEELSSRLDGNIFVAVPELGMMSSVSRTYAVLNPSTSCTVSEVTITPNFPDEYSRRFYTISPRSLSIPPGERGFFQVSFTPPDAETFAAILADPARRSGTVADSSFSVALSLNTPTCSQRLNIGARVTNVPDISPILNLRAYRQRTRLKPQEENEVYVFGEQSRRILRLPSGLPGLFPPILGDIYADVMNNDSSATPPQAPTLRVVPSGRANAIALWRANYAEQDFDNVNQTFLAYLASPVVSWTATSVRPEPGQVYAFRLGAGSVALLYVRRVDNGTETNTNGQSGVEFRAIYPIVGR